MTEKEKYRELFLDWLFRKNDCYVNGHYCSSIYDYGRLKGLEVPELVGHSKWKELWVECIKIWETMNAL